MAAIRADDKIILRIVVLLPLFNKMMTLLVYYGISCCDNNLHDIRADLFMASKTTWMGKTAAFALLYYMY